MVMLEFVCSVSNTLLVAMDVKSIEEAKSILKATNQCYSDRGAYIYYTFELGGERHSLSEEQLVQGAHMQNAYPTNSNSLKRVYDIEAEEARNMDRHASIKIYINATVANRLYGRYGM